MLIITNGKLITWGTPNQILEGWDILIADGVIQKIAPKGEIVRRSAEDLVLDANGQLVMPGNICAHTHYYGVFSRGMAIPGEAPKDFSQILSQLWWNLDKALDEEAVYYSAMVCLVDAIKHGTTTLFDHHASPNFIDGSLDVECEALKRAGLRGSLCYEVTDRDGEERALAGIRENARFISKVAAGDAYSLVRAHFGLHASLTVSEATLERCLAENNGRAGFHVHAAEGIVDQADSLAKYGKRVVERYADTGVLGEKSILVHGVHTEPHEHELLAQSKTWLTHQPRSNMNNAVGVAPIQAMLDAGVKVCIGNDGFSNAMWDEWRSTYLLHKDHQGDPRAMNGTDVIAMGVYQNSNLATQTFDGLRIGVIEPGAAADLIFVDYDPITPMSTGNLPWHILFGFRDSAVTTTIVAGNVLMQDRQLLTLDEHEIAAKARESAQKVWDKVHA